MRLIDADAANIYLNSTGVEMIKDMPGIDLPEGYGLEQVKELVEADKEGRCLVLPCKVGDTVYEWHYSTTTKTIEKSEYTIFGIEINEEKIIYQSDRWKEKGRWGFPERIEYWFYINDIGNSVFLTKEEREKALEGLE